MAEPLAPRGAEIPDDGPPPRAEDFPGCREAPISRDAIEDHDDRLEYWDARSEAAFVAEPTTTYHEYGVQRLVRLTERIAMRRGSPIDVIGAADLTVRDADGERQRLLAADQVVYLHPATTAPRGSEIERGSDHLPDVVLEVDYSTDARRRKLGIYESWGFPEVWIEVPDARWARRPAARRSGLTIYVLEADRYVVAASSRAFPGWTADEIHRGLNEPALTAATADVLRRVADALAAAEGTGPDDDPLLQRERAESRTEERRDIVQSAVRDAFAARSITISPALRAWLDDDVELDRAAAAIIRLAWQCRDAEDFLRQVAGASGHVLRGGTGEGEGGGVPRQERRSAIGGTVRRP